MPKRLWWQRAPANRRACCSIHVRAVFPDGLANSSGAVGRYLMDSVGSDAFGYFPQLQMFPRHNHDGTGGMHLYMPWWKFDRKNEFLRGYHIEFGGGQGMPGVGSFDDACDLYEGYGSSLKQKCRRDYGTVIGFSGRGEMIPNDKSYCEIDPNVVDKWGIPVLRFHFGLERQRNQNGEGYAGDLSLDRRNGGRNVLQ